MDTLTENPNSSDLYDVIRNKFDKITMTDQEGEETIDETEAVQFDIMMNGHAVTLIMIDPNVLKVSYAEAMVSDFDNQERQKWYDLIQDLRKFTVSKSIKFDLHNAKAPMGIKDKEKLAMQSKKEVSESRFSKMEGSKRTSYQGLEKVKVKIRHRKPVDETVQGARARNFSKLFIETVEGERFKFPYPLLAGARAMARHMEEGGSWNDRTGQHILDLSEKIMTIREFARQARSNGVTESAVPVLVRLGEKLDEYKKKLHMMQGSRGYHSYKKTMAETYIEPVEHVATMFARVDDNLMSLMPAVERILGEHENVNVVTESVSRFVDWINTK